jgi:hypothetical protein
MTEEEVQKAITAGIITESETAQLEHTNVWLVTHPAGTCGGENCTVHNRSDHSMRAFRQLWRDDRGIMERLCPHGVGHPDPDEEDFWAKKYGPDNYMGVHGCDGCCRSVLPDGN